MEILVIGGGPGGYVAAIAAAKRGAAVTLVEKDMLGGTCLNRGCIPTKAILHSANLFHEAKDFAEMGIVASAPHVDYTAVARRKDGIVKQLRGGVEFLLGKAGVDVIKGTARFLSRDKVAVATADGEVEIAAQNVIIATGSTPCDLPFLQADGKNIINSDHALALQALPKSMVVIGGGVIGCEFAQAFVRLGVTVTILEALDDLVATMDKDLSALMKRVLKKDGVDIHLSCRVQGAQDTGAGVCVTYSEADGAQKSVTADKVLIATGRRAVADGLDAAAAGVVMGERGNVPVDGGCRTNVDGVYAIGDVTGGIQLAHVASHQAEIAVENIFGGEEEMDERIVPYCIYTSPEMAAMGYTEQKATEAGYAVKTGMFAASANGRSMIEGMRDGLSKAVLDVGDGTVLGIHLAGPNVTEMISPFAGVIKFEATGEDVAHMIFAHPTVSEFIHESILDADKKAIHKV
ncbi:MAG: dihydrolipoyl dehydrogenase [Christensenella sp.]|uniref:dihydrolipoyl dehydrogenase n=1 Tax=Christensenella sp. TaxID=1935934 RepID=UPI002B20C03A|nr:dihydrolipoyl dehydrogenase [Christensenella sp.]MEA5003146.1 dihydrolipoyl dehydrogenase [Christensenella sp.]